MIVVFKDNSSENYDDKFLNSIKYIKNIIEDNQENDYIYLDIDSSDFFDIKILHDFDYNFNEYLKNRIRKNDILKNIKKKILNKIVSNMMKLEMNNIIYSNESIISNMLHLGMHNIIDTNDDTNDDDNTSFQQIIKTTQFPNGDKIEYKYDIFESTLVVIKNGIKKTFPITSFQGGNITYVDYNDEMFYPEKIIDEFNKDRAEDFFLALDKNRKKLIAFWFTYPLNDVYSFNLTNKYENVKDIEIVEYLNNRYIEILFDYDKTSYEIKKDKFMNYTRYYLEPYYYNNIQPRVPVGQCGIRYGEINPYYAFDNLWYSDLVRFIGISDQ